MPAKRSILDLSPRDLNGKRVLLRADLNLPMVDGVVTDDSRARALLPTLDFLVRSGARILVLSHLGRPKGRHDRRYSLRPVARVLGDLWGAWVHFVEASTPPAAANGTAKLAPGDVALLENTRFHPGETTNDLALARAWASLGEVMVNDAFGTAHRAHASTVGLAVAVREKGGPVVAGTLMTRELLFLVHSLDEPLRPFTAILGGAKIAGKVDLVDRLLAKVDRLLVGGAIANTFLAACGYEMGASLVDPARIDLAREFLERGGDKIVLPIDCVTTPRMANDAPHRVVPVDRIGREESAVDIGPETIELFRGYIERARTIVMNGPLGVVDIPAFSGGSTEILRTMADECQTRSLAILGGGDSAQAARIAGVSERLTHVSTGGGASLALLAGDRLPGVDALDDLVDRPDHGAVDEGKVTNRRRPGAVLGVAGE